MRPARAVVDLDALRHNVRLARRLAPHSRVLAVVKADAYGHGAVPVARAIAPHADALAVAGLEEALQLRAAGLEHRIVLLAGFFTADELPEIEAGRFEPVVHSREQVERLLEAKISTPLTVWLKFDAGMHRLGFGETGFHKAYAALSAAPQVAAIVLMTHFSHADQTTDPHTAAQRDRFERAAAGLAGPRSLANSAAILAWPDTHADWIRPGIMLYGWSPLDRDDSAAAELRPVMRLESSLIAIRQLDSGETVGYGGRFTCEQPMRIGVVAIGYGDGYPRAARDGTPVLVNGRRCAIAGRVSMDMVTVDLGEAADAQVGDPVELWGEGLSANEVAAHCDTIAYELVTRIAARVPRHYVDRTAEEEKETR